MKEPLISQISLSLRILLYHFTKCAMSQSAWARCLGSYRSTLKDLEPIVFVLKKIKPTFDPEEGPEPPQRPFCITPMDDWQDMQVWLPLQVSGRSTISKKGDPQPKATTQMLRKYSQKRGCLQQCFGLSLLQRLVDGKREMQASPPLGHDWASGTVSSHSLSSVASSSDTTSIFPPLSYRPRMRTPPSRGDRSAAHLP